MKNFWLDEVTIEELLKSSVCVVLRGSKSTIRGRAIADLRHCSTLADCLNKALEHGRVIERFIGEAEELTLVVGKVMGIYVPTQKINDQKLVKLAFYKWTKTESGWVGEILKEQHE